MLLGVVTGLDETGILGDVLVPVGAGGVVMAGVGELSPVGCLMSDRPTRVARVDHLGGFHQLQISQTLMERVLAPGHGRAGLERGLVGRDQGRRLHG